MQGKKLTDKETEIYKKIYLKCLEQTNGFHQLVPKQLDEENPEINIKWDRFKGKWCDNDPLFKLEFEDIKKRAVRRIENVLYNSALGGDVRAIQIYLKGRDGALYGDKSSVDVNLNQPVSIQIIKPNDLKDED